MKEFMNKITSRSQFWEKFSSQCSWLQRNRPDLLDQLLPLKQHKWTDETLIESARKYNSRSEWSKMNGAAYATARLRGKVFFEDCCSHMKSIQRIKYTDEELIETAKKYSSRKEWESNEGGAIAVARKRGKEFYELCCVHMIPSKNEKWSVEELIDSARKYNTRKEWEDNDSAAYNAALKRGGKFHELCGSHMGPRSNEKYTDEELIETAKKYSSRKEWEQSESGAYTTALKRGGKFHELCCTHMGPRSNEKWTDEELIESARKYNSRSEWQKKEPGAVTTARKRGKEFYELCCMYMKASVSKKWTDEELIETAKKYSSRKEWGRNENGSYKASRLRGKEFHGLCCVHMKKPWQRAK